MYLKFFKMQRLPFSNDIDVNSLYQSEGFTEVLSRLKFACDNQMFAVLTAAPGSGKSTLLRMLKSQLDPLKYEFIYISDSRLSPRWLYNNMLEQLGCKQYFYRGDGMRCLHEQLQIIRGVQGKKIVCCIDEAHLLDLECIEEIRFLLNCQMDSFTPLSLILSGQTELKDRLKRSVCRAVAQRVKMICSLSPLTREQTQRYIENHLKYSKTKVNDIFTDEAVDAIYAYSSGNPRMINNACHQSLLHAASNGKMQIDGQTVTNVIETELF